MHRIETEHCILCATRSRRAVDLGSALLRVESLTDREREVFRLLAGALSNGEIAQILTITERTVKAHTSNILLKLGVENRLHACLAAYRHHSEYCTDGQ